MSTRVLITIHIILLTATAGFASGKSSIELITPKAFKVWSAAPLAKDNTSMPVYDAKTGEVIFSRNGGRETFVMGPKVTDYTLTVKFKIGEIFNKKYGAMNIFMRAAKSRRSYWIYLRPGFRGIGIQKIISGYKLDPMYVRAAKIKRLPRLRPGVIYTLECKAEGQKIEVRLNGKLHVEAVDRSPDPILSGRTGFGGGGMKFDVKSLKIAELSRTARLNAASYRYGTAPESGDKDGRILLDGKVNRGENQALWWLSAKGDPEIIFDLRKIVLVEKALLKAFAVPAANIASVKVLGSKDGKIWKVGGYVINKSEERTEGVQSLECPAEIPARYIKIIIYKTAADTPVKLSEVEFFGRENFSGYRKKASPQKYFTLYRLHPMPPKGKADKNWLCLKEGKLTVPVLRSNGIAGPVLFDGTPLTMTTYDKYYLETRKTKSQAVEYDNRVTSAKLSPDGKTLIMECRNQKLPDIKIRIVYTLADGIIRKKTEFVNTGKKKDVFLTVATETVLDRKFRSGGWYFGADRGLGGRMQASEVTVPTMTTAHAPLNSKTAGLINYPAKKGIIQYLFKINDTYLYPVMQRWNEKANTPPVFLPYGWNVGLCTLHLKPGEAQSLESHCMIFRDDERNYYRRYRNLPEVVAEYKEIVRPEWLKEFKAAYPALAIPQTPKTEKIFLDLARKLTEIYETGNINMFINGEDFWGDWYCGKKTGLGWTGQVIDNEFLKRFIAKIHKISPRIKVNLYTWAWTGSEYSRTFQAHPDWFIRQSKRGEPLKAYHVGQMNYMRKMNIPASRENLLDSAKLMMRDFNQDMFYIDGGSGGPNQIDWQELQLDSPVHWNKFHTGLGKIARSKPDGAFFINGRTGSYFDIGFFEGLNTKLNRNSWRESGDALWSVKMRQDFDPLQTVIPYYWRSNTYPYYSNYCIGLGMYTSNIYEAVFYRNIAYVNAAFEMKFAKTEDVGLSPDWRKDSAVETEAYTLSKGPGKFISIIDHSKLPQPVELKVDAKKFGLDLNRPVYSWLFRGKDIRPRKYGLSEKQSRLAYENGGWGLNLIMKPKFTGIIKPEPGQTTLSFKRNWDKELLNMVMLTNSPALVFSVGGRRTNLWLPETLGVTLTGKTDQKNHRIVIDKKGKKAIEALITIPRDWNNLRSSAKIREVFIGRKKFLIAAMPADVNRIVITASPGKPLEFFKSDTVKISGNLKAGGTLRVESPAKADRYFLTVYDEGTPALFQEGAQPVFNPQLPETFKAGDYRAEIVAVSGNRAQTGSGEFKVTDGHTPPKLKQLPRKRPGVKKVAPVNRKINGINVLNSAVQSWDSRFGPLHAKVDLDTLTLSSGSLDQPHTRYGHAFAGIESDNLKIVTIKLRNTFYKHFCNYERNTYSSKSPALVGILIDYHTPAGYVKRVALGLGLMKTARKSRLPSIGANRAISQFVKLDNFINSAKTGEVTIDLAKWAPPGWDGKAWLWAAADGGLYGARRIYLTLTRNSSSADGRKITSGRNLTPRTTKPKFRPAKFKDKIRIDGKLNEKDWKKSRRYTGFRTVPNLDIPSRNTVMLIGQDKNYLYLGIICGEKEKKLLGSNGSRLWLHDGLDIAFGKKGSKDFHKFVIDWEGKVFEADYPSSAPKRKWKIKTACAPLPKGGYIVEMAIPLKDLKRGGNFPFNLARYRPGREKMEIYSLVPLEELNLLNPELWGSMELISQ